MQSIPALRNYSLRVELRPTTNGQLAELWVFTDKGDLPHSIHQVNRDLMYERIQVIVDNHLRQMATKLTAEMRKLSTRQKLQDESEDN